MIANYHSIETFSSLDGPGIRYVLFLQGCNFSCKFCHNVDTIPTLCNKQITDEEVVKDYLKYSKFYKNGGITISGGEPLMQTNFIIELFKKLKEFNVHTCIETNGSLFNESNTLKNLVELTDLFLVDLKGVDNEHSLPICGNEIDNTLLFFEYLNKVNKKFSITYVLLPGINDDNYCVEKLATLLNKFNDRNRSFKILPYRLLGVEKWKQLNLEYQLEHLLEPRKEDVEVFVKRVKIEMLKQITTK